MKATKISLVLFIISILVFQWTGCSNEKSNPTEVNIPQSSKKQKDAVLPLEVLNTHELSILAQNNNGNYSMIDFTFEVQTSLANWSSVGSGSSRIYDGLFICDVGDDNTSQPSMSPLSFNVTYRIRTDYSDANYVIIYFDENRPYSCDTKLIFNTTTHRFSTDLIGGGVSCQVMSTYSLYLPNLYIAYQQYPNTYYFVDGSAYTSVTMNFPIGSTHSISAPTDFWNNYHYIFDHWSDGVTSNARTITINDDMYLNPIYRIQ